MQEERDNLILQLNLKTNDEKDSFWLSNERQYKDSEKDGDLEFNWYFFTKLDIWMCKIYDYTRMKRGQDLVKEILFLNDKEEIKKYYK